MIAVAVAVALLSGCLAGCVGPSRSHADYVEKVANTAEAARSAVETGLLTVRAVEQDTDYGHYISRILSDMEGDIGSVATGFASVQPPSTNDDRLRAGLTALLDEARSVLSRMRIAARRADRPSLLAAARPLPEISRRLRRYEELAPT